MATLLGFIGGIGTTELLVFLAILLLLFGHRLPSMMRGMGKGISEFKKGINETSEEEKNEIPPTGEKQRSRPIEEKSST